jgi:hypothetical protein
MQCAGACGVQFALDEKLHPSKNSTGFHFHIQLVPGTTGGHGDLPVNNDLNCQWIEPTMNAHITNKLIILVLFPVLLHSARAGDNCQNGGLLESATQAISHAYPGWIVTQLPQLSERNQELWQGRHGLKCPGIVAGNFVPNAHKSLAVLLTRQKDDGLYLRVILMVPADQGYKILEVVPESGAEADNVLTLARPGKYTDIDGKSVIIKRDGIILEQLESGAVLSYWSRNKFHSLVLSE